MTRHKLMIICYLSLSICAQAGSLTPEKRSQLRSLEDELRISTIDFGDYAKSFSPNDNKLSDCFDKLSEKARRTSDIISEFIILADLSSFMVDKTDESRVDKQIMFWLPIFILEVRGVKKQIQLRQAICDSDNLMLVKSEQTINLVERAVDLLNSAKRHFER